jgi:DNA mismatch repair protein MutS2
MRNTGLKKEATNDEEARLFAAELGDPPEIDLHGLQDVVQGTHILDQFLHSEFMVGTDAVRIIHGRGSGKMRQAVYELLASHELVEFFRDSHHPNEMQGVTYAVLAKKF